MFIPEAKFENKSRKSIEAHIWKSLAENKH